MVSLSAVSYLAGAVAAGAAVIGLALDTGQLTRWSAEAVTGSEQTPFYKVRKEPASIVSTAMAAPAPALTGPLASLLTAEQWLNTPPLQAADLVGKPVLVNFWTYSCINCLRALPHVRAWAERYKSSGLVVIGVHTPEFAFEKNPGNVKKALASLGVSYPVAIDNDFGIWRAFENRSWPALYFIGADGRIRHRVLGEGEYSKSEHLIRKLLSEANRTPIVPDPATISANGPQAPADARNLRSAETYIGYREADDFANPGSVKKDVPNLYRSPVSLPINRWSLSGVWTIGQEYASLSGPSGRIAYRFHARDLHLVMAPPADGAPVRFRVTIDGAAPGADHGSDVDAEGWGSLQEDRLYQLVRQTGQIVDRTFEIEFFDPGVRGYAFTFG